MQSYFKKHTSKLFDCLAGEFLFKIFLANSGAVIALRAMWVTLVYTILALLVYSACDPCRVGPISVAGAKDVFWNISSSVAIFLGASYLAFYARFVSQWGYLAGLYNMIKQAECVENSNACVIAEWKAAYLEDAQNLHLAAKSNLAPVVHAWIQDKRVTEAYIRNTPGGENRLNRLRDLANKAFLEEEERWAR